jgi:dCMP deaminase
MIIGMTGTKASGKGIVTEILKEKGFFYTSTSDQVRKEAAARGMATYTIADLQNIGNEIREKFGSEELIKRCLKESEGKDNIVIDGIRNPGEIKEIKKVGGIMIAVDAAVELRFERLLSRKRESDPKTLEAFKQMEARDRGNKESETGQQVDKCMEMSDHLIINDTTLETLKTKIEYILLKEKSKETSINQGAGITDYKRPSWDEYFMEVCKAIAKRATCDRGRSGCVIAKDKQLLVTGYVGSPIGMPHCDEVGHLFKQTVHEDGKITNHCVRTVHAEQNAICQAAKLGVALNGSTMYCKMTPCRVCGMLIINSGIKRVVCEKGYQAGKDSEEMFEKAGVELVILNPEIEDYNKK